MSEITDSKFYGLKLGRRQENDKLVHNLEISVKKPLWLPTPVGLVETYPTSDGSKITYINATNLKTNGHGARVEVIAGGPSETFVTLKFTSQPRHSVEFKLEIYAIEENLYKSGVKKHVLHLGLPCLFLIFFLKIDTMIFRVK